MASSQQRPATSSSSQTQETPDNLANLIIPARISSLYQQTEQPMLRMTGVERNQQCPYPKTLAYAYMVCGVGREPSQWAKAPALSQGKVQHMKNAVGQFWLPEILGSNPRQEQDGEVARVLHSAMRASFPNDVEVCTGDTPPPCTNHSFVLQQDASQTFYGVTLKIWSKAHDEIAESIRDLRKEIDLEFCDKPGVAYWIPYCLSFVSRYPLYDLLGDYLRGMWIRWHSSTDVFQAEEVSRVLGIAAPRLNDIVKIDLKSYTLSYQFPEASNRFQNFHMWPLFSCLSISNIVDVIEAALSPTQRIIFTSHYPSMLTLAAETIRYFVRAYEWTGLYVPIVHARWTKELVAEPGPYILGITAECKSLFTPPREAILVDLDRNVVLCSDALVTFTPRQRMKIVKRMTQALGGDVLRPGVPEYLQSAYYGSNLVLAGQFSSSANREVEFVQDPGWWDQEAIVGIVDHVWEKMNRKSRVKIILGNNQRKIPTKKVSTQYLNSLTRDKNQSSRETMEAWQDFVNLKCRTGTEISNITKRNDFLVDELENWKKQFLKFQTFIDQLTTEIRELKGKIRDHTDENRRINASIQQHREAMTRLKSQLLNTEKQRDDAIEAVAIQQAIVEQLEHERVGTREEISILQEQQTAITRQRDEARRVVLHLQSLISSQTSHFEHIVRTFEGEQEELELEPEDLEEPSDDEEPIPPPFEPVDLDLRVKNAAREPKTNLKEERRTSRSHTPDMDNNIMCTSFYEASCRKRDSEASLLNVGDRQLREKTDHIAAIIRGVSEQCAAAVQGLQLTDDIDAGDGHHARDSRVVSTISSGTASDLDSDMGHSLRQRHSIISPTPDLIDPSSTPASLSGFTTPEHAASIRFRGSTSDMSARILSDDYEGFGVCHSDTYGTISGATRKLAKGLHRSRSLH